MATAATSGKAHCVTCGKPKVAYKCEGCSQNFCLSHLADHHQLLGKQFDEIENNRNLFRQTLTEQKNNLQKHSLMKQIEKWERESIHEIRETAEEARALLITHTTGHVSKIEIELTKLTEEIKQTRQENDFNEIILNEFKQKLAKLQEQLVKPSDISIRQDSASLVAKICVVTSSSSASAWISNIDVNAKWVQNGVTMAGGNGQGNGLNQLSNPYSAYVDDDETIYVADYSNNRIMGWKKGAISGQVVAGGKGVGNRTDQLNYPTGVFVDIETDSLIICDYNNSRVMRWPRQNGTSGEIIISNVGCWGVTMDNDGYLYVSDVNKYEVRRYKVGDPTGIVVAGGNGGGNRLDQLNTPRYVFVDQDHSVYVSEDYNHRVTKWMRGAKEGIVVAGGQGPGNGLTQLSYPSGISVDQLGTVYVADSSNHRVVCWPKRTTQGSVVAGGGNGAGGIGNQFNGPFNLSFDRQNNLYVVDKNNHRVQKFDIDHR